MNELNRYDRYAEVLLILCVIIFAYILASLSDEHQSSRLDRLREVQKVCMQQGNVLVRDVNGDYACEEVRR